MLKLLFAWTRCFVAAASLGLISNLHAQTIHDGGMWLAFFGNDDLKIRDPQKLKLKWWFDSQLRLLEDADGLQQSLIRPGIGLEIEENTTLWGGYAWIHNSPITGDNFDEHRIWQQWMWTPKSEVMNYVIRLRYEQRYVETGDDVGLRWRQFFRAQRKLQARPNLSLVAWNETFFHLNNTDWGAETGFDQNRLFLGLGIENRFATRGRFEIGYLNQTIDQSGPSVRSNHILSLNYFY